MSQHKNALRVASALIATALLFVMIAIATRGEATAQASADEVIAGADIAHIVSVSTPLVSSNGEVKVTETWVNQKTGDVSIQIKGPDGSLQYATIRHGLILVEYSALADGIETRQVLSKDDPALQGLTDHLLRYREGLRANRNVVRVGETGFQGRPAIEVRAAKGSESEHVAYLDPTTLFPIGVVGLDGNGYSTVYRTIESLRLNEAPPDAFDVALPSVSNESHYQALPLNDAARLVGYPLWNLGSTFADYTLTGAQRYWTEGRGQYDADSVYFVYQQSAQQSNVESWIEIIARPPLTVSERTGLAHAEADGVVSDAEKVVVNGQPATLRTEGTRFRLTLENEDGAVFVLAPTREIAIAAAESLQLVTSD